eukprot:jgi/Chlat1/2526/Chrsp175S02382
MATAAQTVAVVRVTARSTVAPAAAPAPLAGRPSFVTGRALRLAAPKAAARSAVFVTRAANRDLWFPGGDAPEWLDGSLPGDYGFDPLGLGSDPELLKWFAQAELQNGRWAMLGVAGIMIPELLTKFGILNTPSWNVAGAEPYFAPANTLFASMMLFFAWAEGRRWADIINPGSVNEDPIFKGNKVTGKDVGYPGGLWFNPLNYASDPKSEKELRLKEIKNGRLAMVAFVGFCAQAYATGKGPIDNLFQHLSDPSHNTVFQTFFHK